MLSTSWPIATTWFYETTSVATFVVAMIAPYFTLKFGVIALRGNAANQRLGVIHAPISALLQKSDQS